ncbi:hypothetical protein C0992_012674 [Termitomyces sp. T32_za158]|nr:hypothetical protein C0992_012674 [Termitomyces sp. T32_za158]
MRVFEKWLWHKGQAVEVMWSRENKLREWCMARYMENVGVAWLVPFEANFALAPLSIDKQLASLLADEGPFTLWTELSPDSKVAAYVKPLVQMDLACQEQKWAEAAAQSAAIMLAEREAELLEEWRIILSELLAKHMANAQAAGFLEAVEVGAATSGDAVGTGEAAEGSAVPAVKAAAAEPADESEAPEAKDNADNEDNVPVTPKRVLTAGGSGPQKVVPQYEPPTATTFTDTQLCNLLVPRRDEVVLDNNRRAGENVPGVKGKKTVLLAACNNFKSLKELCDKCWADNNPECCWYPTGAQPCHRCDALKWACTISGWKSRKCGKVNPHIQRNFEKVVLVRRARAFVLEQRKLSVAGKAILISAASLALPTAQESGCVVDVVDLAPPTPKDKAKVQPNYTPLPTPRVDGQEFLWLRKALDYPISTLCPSKYIEAAKEKVAGMAEVMQKNVQVAVTEMEGLRLRKKIMERSVDILEWYQANCADALEWQEANETHLQQPFTALFLLPPGTSLDPQTFLDVSLYIYR